MRSPTPFATWLKTFLASDRAPLFHLGRSPDRRRWHSIIAVRRWAHAYPFRAVTSRTEYAETLDRLRTESAHLSYLPWLFDPDVWLTLTAASLEYLTTNIPLVPGDLNLPVKSARLLGVHPPVEIGPVAPRVALILYMLSSVGAPLRRFSRVRRIDQLAVSVRRQLEWASPADLIAIHVLMRRLLTMRQERWAARALELCLPLSPLTWLLEDSPDLSRLAAYDWRGIELVLAGFCLDGLQTRCSQMFIESMLPGWDWHAAEDAERYARFRRAAELFNRLTWALDNARQTAPASPDSDGGLIQAMRLAAWILRTYRLMGRALDVYQRIVLPPPPNPAAPDQIPSFRMLRQFLPVRPDAIHENVAGLAAPICPVMSLLVEASRITSTPVYVPDALLVGVPMERLADESGVGVSLAARHLIAAWESLGPTCAALMSNLYQFVLKSQRDM